MDLFGVIKAAQASSTSPADESQAWQKGQVLTARVLAVTPPDQTTLRIGQRVIQAVLSRLMEPGEDILLKVVETHPNPILTLLDPEDERHPAMPRQAVTVADLDRVSLEALKKDALLKLVILEKTAPDLIRVQLLPVRNAAPPVSERQPGLTARLTEPFLRDACQPGREVFGQVLETSPKLVLRLDVPPERSAGTSGPLPDASPAAAASPTLPEAAAGLRALIETLNPPSGPLSDAMAELSRCLMDLSPKGPLPDIDFLHRLPGNTGLAGDRSPLQEAVGKLLSAAIKPTGLEAIRSDPAFRDMLETAVRLFQTLESNQASGLETFLRDDALQLAFPIFWPPASGRGDINIGGFANHRRNPDTHPLRIAMLLNLTRIGPIKIDVELFRQRLKAGFWTMNAAVRDIVARRRPELVRSLADRGLTVEALTVGILPDSLVPKVADSPAPAARDPRTIDLKV